MEFSGFRLVWFSKGNIDDDLFVKTNVFVSEWLARGGTRNWQTPWMKAPFSIGNIRWTVLVRPLSFEYWSVSMLLNPQGTRDERFMENGFSVK